MTCCNSSYTLAIIKLEVTLTLETVDLMQMRVQSAIVVSCLFAVGSLILPSHNQAVAAGITIGKSLGGSVNNNGCSEPIKDHTQDQGCKPDLKKLAKVDLDRKGHKVVKGRGR